LIRHAPAKCPRCHGGRREGGHPSPSQARRLRSSSAELAGLGAELAGALRRGLFAATLTGPLSRPKVDALFQDCGRLENHSTARRNGCGLSGLGVATHALRFLANDERAEGREFDRFAALKATQDFLEDSSTRAAASARESPAAPYTASYKCSRVTVFPVIAICLFTNGKAG
jgi:hypothetical protein